MKITAVSQQRKPKKAGVHLEISLLDCLTTKKIQDFSKI